MTSTRRFDFAKIAVRTGEFDPDADTEETEPPATPVSPDVHESSDPTADRT